MKKLPLNVQSLLCANAQIINYKRIIEELVYNSIDAESTSVAIRVSVQDNTVQVIDNGCGIPNQDFNLLGMRYMTSKFVDSSALTSAPNKYGFQGQSMANIIEVSESVRVTSRCEKIEETWVKTFCKGDVQNVCKTSKRQSKGTTVEIKGFLYNMHIRKKTINQLNELQNIKSFLEQLSLAHINISLSLRDDTKNEIVFKVKKSRDIYQTLSSLFGIEKTHLQEFQVAKKQYKVIAYVAKRDEDVRKYHWIYLNGIFLSNCRLQTIVNNYFVTALCLGNHNKCNRKNQKVDNNVPLYFIFLSCPRTDYDIIRTSDQQILEFKDWEPISKLLAKLVQFYDGEIKLKSVENPINYRKEKENDIKVEIKKIMDKVLGNKSRKLGVSQLQNGVKGKLTKRRHKKKSKVQALTTSLLKETCINVKFPKTLNGRNLVPNNNIAKPVHSAHSNEQNKVITNDGSNMNDTVQKIHKTTIKSVGLANKSKKRISKVNIKPKYCDDSIMRKFLINSSVKRRCNALSRKTKVLLNNRNLKKLDYNANNSNLLTVVRNIHKSINYDLKSSKHSHMMSQEEDNELYNRQKSHETILCSRNIDINKRVSTLENDSNNKLRKFYPYKLAFAQDKTSKSTYCTGKIKGIKTSYDLLQPILKSQKYTSDVSNNNSPRTKSPSLRFSSKAMKNTEREKYTFMPILTFNSHNYFKEGNYVTNKKNNNQPNMRFMSKQSRDNFVVLNQSNKNCANKIKLRHNKLINFKHQKHSNRKFVFKVCGTFKNTEQESIYTIECSTTNYEDRPNNKYCDDNALINIKNTHKNKKIYSTQKTQSNTYTATKKSLKVFNNNHDIENCNTEDVHYSRDINQILKYNVSDCNNQSCIKIMTSSEHKMNVQNDYKVENNFTINKTYTINNISWEIINGNHDKKYSISEDNEWNSNEIPKTIVSNYNKDSNSEIWAFGEHVSVNTCHTKNYNKSSENTELLLNQPTALNIINDKNLEPLNLCKIVLFSSSDIQKEFQCSFRQKSSNNYENSNEVIKTVKHYLSLTRENNQFGTNRDIPEVINYSITDKRREENSRGLQSQISYVMTESKNMNRFNLKNRPRFLPKGMSPIFENCNTKNICDYQLSDDYFEHDIYSNFAKDVKGNAEIFKPTVQNSKEIYTREIYKVNNRLNKENTPLIFHSGVLKQAKVLNQVDNKFIAAIVKENCKEVNEISEYLVLFDQHAVHERIMLEKNLSGYFTGIKWRSVTLDGIRVKLTKDEIIYLHNYKDKFTQFGLQWIILDNEEISITAIPKAILGKNPRQCDIVVKAIKNLIAEEINTIKSQSGNVSMYPKSIMDLVFSEACRYAIKFGDKLSKTDCVDMLKLLSDCKTPFQCAHGRPVMAVLTHVTPTNHHYKIDLNKLHRFKK